MKAPQLSVGYLLRSAFRTFAKVLAIELGRHDITVTQWSVLRVLWEQEGISQVELANGMLVEKATLTSVLASMVAAGLVVRSQSKLDRRKFTLNLTPKARALKPVLFPIVERVNAVATSAMSEHDVERLCVLLSRMVASLKTVMEGEGETVSRSVPSARASKRRRSRK